MTSEIKIIIETKAGCVKKVNGVFSCVINSGSRFGGPIGVVSSPTLKRLQGNLKKCKLIGNAEDFENYDSLIDDMKGINK